MWAVLAQAAHADCAPKLQVKYMFSQLAIYACSLVEIMFPVSKDNHLCYQHQKMILTRDNISVNCVYLP
jgi:hypothetical protein